MEARTKLGRLAQRLGQRIMWEHIVLRTARESRATALATQHDVAIIRDMIATHNPRAAERAVWLCNHVLLPAGKGTEAISLLRQIRRSQYVTWEPGTWAQAVSLLSSLSPGDFARHH